MPRRFFRTLATCVFASFLLLAMAAYLQLPPWAATAGSVMPLLYYHLLFLRPKASAGLPQAAIDSVYYFGFLITVFALGISAVSIAVGNAAKHVEIVVYQFGTGLFATGYAVIARIHLASLGGVQEEAGSISEMDRCVKHSMEMLTNIEMASARLEEFWNAMADRTAKVNDTARQTVENAFLEVAGSFQDEMKSSLASTRENLMQIRGLVADMSFTHEREALNRSIKATIEACSQLNSAFSILTAKAIEGSQSTQDSIASVNALAAGLDRFSARIERLGGANGALAVASHGMLKVSESAAASNAAIRKSVDGLSEISATIAGTEHVFIQMQRISQAASDQLASLANASDRIGKALTTIESSTVATESLQSCIARLSTAFQPLAVRAEMLTGQLEKAGNVSERLEQQFGGLPRYAAVLKDLEQGMGQSLRQISHSLSTAASQAQHLSLNTANSAKALESANKLLTSADSLQDTLSALRQLFNDMTKSIASTQTILSDSSRGFREAVSSSVLAIDTASKRVATAAYLQPERMSADEIASTNAVSRRRRPDENV